MMANTKKLNTFLTVIFFLSGLSGLIYESIWTKYLKLFLGHAAYAQALVLIVFMGGMSIGAWLIGQKVEKIKNPLRVYAVVEFVIGVFALGFDRAYSAITSVLYEFWLPAMVSTDASYLLIWFIAAVLILPPAILLGATFPLMSNGVTRLQPKQSGKVVASLYFVNSLGGAIGVLFNSFFLVKAVGLPGSILTAGLANVLLASLVWLATSNYQAAPLQTANLPIKKETVWSILWLAGLTGCASFMYEIGWIRMLSMVLGSSTHSFELMLSAFITGLALGGWWIKHRIDKLKSTIVFLAVVQLLMGCSAILSLWGYSQTFEVISWVYSTVQRNEQGYQVYSLVSHMLAFLLMVPATFCAGMTLPLITQWLIQSGYGEKSVGHVYSANTIGSIMSVLIAVHLVMPGLGLKWVVLIGAMIDVSLGIWILWFYKGAQKGLYKWVLAPVSLVLVYFAGLHFELDPYRMASGVFRNGIAKVIDDVKVEYLIDGKTATISVLKYPDGKYSIATNGKVDAGLYVSGNKRTTDESTMALLGSLGFAHHDHPKRIAAIGMGSGMSSHFVLSSDLPERLDTIEIEPVVVDLAKKAFGQRVGRTFNDPRSNIVIEDAKTYFAMGNKKYDVIISEPSNPWVSGVATLFTQEFYKHLSRHLDSDGILLQWIQAYETDVRIVATIVKALRTEFKDYAIYYANENDIIVVATKRDKLKYDYSKMFSSPSLKAELAHLAINTIDDVRIRLLGDKEILDRYFTNFPVPINSDFFPYVDLHAAQFRFSYGNAAMLMSIPYTDLSSLRYFHPQVAAIDFAQLSKSQEINRVNEIISEHQFVNWLLDGKSSNQIEHNRLSYLYLLAEGDCKSNPIMKARIFYSIAKLGLSVSDVNRRYKYWDKLKELTCYKQVEESQIILSLLKESSAANYSAMSELSLNLLMKNPTLIATQPQVQFALKALLIAENAQGRFENVEKYWQSYVLGNAPTLAALPGFQTLYLMSKTKSPLH